MLKPRVNARGRLGRTLTCWFATAALALLAAFTGTAQAGVSMLRAASRCPGTTLATRGGLRIVGTPVGERPFTRLFSCYRGEPRRLIWRVTLDETDPDVDRLALAGEYFAYQLRYRVHASLAVDHLTAVVVRHLGTGRVKSISQLNQGAVRRLVVSHNGGVAWSARFRHGAGSLHVQDLIAKREGIARTDTILDQASGNTGSTAIDLNSLRLTGSTLSWRHGAVTRTATLQPRPTPRCPGRTVLAHGDLKIVGVPGTGGYDRLYSCLRDGPRHLIWRATGEQHDPGVNHLVVAGHYFAYQLVFRTGTAPSDTVQHLVVVRDTRTARAKSVTPQHLRGVAALVLRPTGGVAWSDRRVYRDLSVIEERIVKRDAAATHPTVLDQHRRGSAADRCPPTDASGCLPTFAVESLRLNGTTLSWYVYADGSTRTATLL